MANADAAEAENDDEGAVVPSLPLLLLLLFLLPLLLGNRAVATARRDKLCTLYKDDGRASNLKEGRRQSMILRLTLKGG